MVKNIVFPWGSRQAKSLSGTITVPGDKSVSHRALMFGALALGHTKITGLLTGHDVLHTAEAMRCFGANITVDEKGDYHIDGVGVGGLKEPNSALDFGNAGTGVRLTMGLCSTYGFTTVFYGDASLCKRPMGRILEPIRLFGTKSVGRSGDRLPLALVGTDNAIPVTYTLPMASAQVKSAVLLAGLHCGGETRVIETIPTRDHTERMLRHFGAKVEVTEEKGKNIICLRGYPTLSGADVIVPSDPSSAAFPIVAALITPDSKVTVKNVLLNPTRTGLLTTLQEMGANITIDNEHISGGELCGDITASTSELKGVVVPPERAASMIDEYPILCIAAACAEGKTVMYGIEELRVKESDRIAAMAKGLKANHIHVTEEKDGLVVTGGVLSGGVTIETFMDHRIAMSFLIAGAVSTQPIAIDNGAFIATSFPHFAEMMNTIGLKIEETAQE